MRDNRNLLLMLSLDLQKQESRDGAKNKFLLYLYFSHVISLLIYNSFICDSIDGVNFYIFKLFLSLSHYLYIVVYICEVTRRWKLYDINY